MSDRDDSFMRSIRDAVRVEMGEPRVPTWAPPATHAFGRNAWAVVAGAVLAVVVVGALAIGHVLSHGSPATSSTLVTTPTPTATPAASQRCGQAPVPTAGSSVCISFTPGTQLTTGDHQTIAIQPGGTYSGDLQFTLPAGWSETSTAPNASKQYYETDLASVTSLGAFCSNAAHHHLQPFGGNPSIIVTPVAGHSACEIIPSSDQSSAFYEMAELAVLLPGDVVLGDAGMAQSYDAVTFIVPSSQLRALAASIHFS